MNEKMKKFASLITGSLNTYCFDHKEFCLAMSGEHRTLQQSFTRFCFQWLVHCASREYGYDERNRQSHITAKRFLESYHQVYPIGQPSESLPVI
jgi:hypothetical protein